jgi:hypothetical protein
MTEEKFSPEQSLKIIQSMIEKAKQDVADNSFYFLLWGWLVFTAALLHFSLIKFTDYRHPYMAWNLIFIGIVASIAKGIKENKRERVKTFVGDTMKYFGISMIIIYLGLAFIFGRYDLWTYSYPIYILVFAGSCFFMGSLMQFPLLKWAGVSCLGIVAASIYVGFEWQLLLMALAVLIGNIIPGHLLTTKEKLQKTNI